MRSVAAARQALHLFTWGFLNWAVPVASVWKLLIVLFIAISWLLLFLQNNFKDFQYFLILFTLFTQAF